MFSKPKEPTPYDLEEARLFEYLLAYHCTDDEYANTIKNLETLIKIREHGNEAQNKMKLVVLSASASIGSVAMMLHWEHAHVIVSKALGFIPKLARL